MDRGWADSDGLRIRWSATGSGPAMVLVHGWGSDGEANWLRTGWVDALAPLRRVVMLDVRGHGASDKPLDAACYGYADMARDVLAVLDALLIEQADYLGYSMGAFMGAWLLGHHPERFRTMALGGVGIETASSVAAAPRIAAGLRADDPADVDDPLGEACRRFVDADPRMDATGREALAVSALRMWPDGDAVALGGTGLARVALPVLVAVGTDDPPYTESAPVFAGAVPGARLLELQGCDHLAAVTDPGFRTAVLELLQER
jgi:pimeloyl-ACP methyl ester carboxylesterase